jgi:hypothetical protein
VTVGELFPEERREIIKKTLSQFGKKLNQEQMDLVITKQDAAKPLYLVVGKN